MQAPSSGPLIPSPRPHTSSLGPPAPPPGPGTLPPHSHGHYPQGYLHPLPSAPDPSPGPRTPQHHLHHPQGCSRPLPTGQGLALRAAPHISPWREKAQPPGEAGRVAGEEGPPGWGRARPLGCQQRGPSRAGRARGASPLPQAAFPDQSSAVTSARAGTEPQSRHHTLTRDPSGALPPRAARPL